MHATIDIDLDVLLDNMEGEQLHDFKVMLEAREEALSLEMQEESKRSKDCKLASNALEVSEDRDYSRYMSRFSALVDLVESNFPKEHSWIEYKELLMENGYVDTGHPFAYMGSINLETWISDMIDHSVNDEASQADLDNITHELDLLKTMSKDISPAPSWDKEKLREAAVSLVCSIDNEEGFFSALQEMQDVLLQGQ